MNAAVVRSKLLVGDLLQPHDDVLAVCIPAQLNDVLADIAVDGCALALVAHVDDLLDHIVGVGVAHHRLQHAVTGLGVHRVVQVEGHVDNGPDHLIAVALARVLQALLDHIRGELVGGEL